jgi:4-diphosphocytidyl-2-C-methyl-D-erythritol kinase
MDRLTLFSPAKINLFLRVVSKRLDGYHNLSSVFQTISLGDTLTVNLSDEDRLTATSHLTTLPSSHPQAELSLDHTNLVAKAVALFKMKTGFTGGFDIHLDKHIPMQAGLGGGSSNAASALWGCNELAKTRISSAILQEWGAELGSDVPFFFSQGTAYCTGRGEEVHSLPALPAQQIWIVKPPEGLSTPEVFKRFKLQKTESHIIQRDLDAFLSGSIPPFNDLEGPAFEAKPSLLELKLQLQQGGFQSVLMSGSGTAFFCLGQGVFPKNQQAMIYSTTTINRKSTVWYQSSQWT